MTGHGLTSEQWAYFEAWLVHVASDEVAVDNRNLGLEECAAGLADSWAPALAASWASGRQRGHAEGVRAAERSMAERWSLAHKQVKDVLRRPTYAELRRRRGEAGA